VAIERGVGTQAIKVFGKAYLLRSLSPTECLRYVLSQPGVHVAICGAGTQECATLRPDAPSTEGRHGDGDGVGSGGRVPERRCRAMASRP